MMTEHHHHQEAASAETFVEERSGRWYVGIAVLFDDGVVRKEINSYRSQREAEIAARYIRRSANRNLRQTWGPDVVGVHPEDPPGEETESE